MSVEMLKPFTPLTRTFVRFVPMTVQRKEEDNEGSDVVLSVGNKVE